MGIYIWLVYYNIAINCVANTGCMQVSMAHLNYLIGIGSIELIFELGGIIRIFMKKSDPNKPKNSDDKTDGKR